MSDILFKDESYRIIGALMEVHKNLGAEFLEGVYCEAIELEIRKISVPYEREKKLQINYEGKVLKKFFRADFVCFNTILLEIKSSPLTKADQQ